MRRLKVIFSICVFLSTVCGLPIHTAVSLEGHPDFLQQIRINQPLPPAAAARKTIKIAVIDTGVDLNHSELKKRLIEGKNMLKPGTPPQDDHGHGTNVAGVIDAVLRAVPDQQLTERIQIMPVKALDSLGQGDEDLTGDAILYAIKQEVQIIVMSLGLYDYSKYLEDVVNYARTQNVLMIAASGNESGEVMYPAAMPGVISVGGVDAWNQIVGKSNWGAQLDLVAPWNVTTAKLGGGTAANNGSSMAAPQIAALSALLWTMNPQYKASDIRELLYQSTEDLLDRGWDPRTGYGVIRADLLLKNKLISDAYEPNDFRTFAVRIPEGKPVRGRMDSVNDKDWFKLSFVEPGTVELTVKTTALRWKITDGKTVQGPFQGNRRVSFEAKEKGIRFVVFPEPLKTDPKFKPVSYELQADYQIKSDRMEPNNKMEQATRLPQKTTFFRATFHGEKDIDYYQIKMEREGTLTVNIHPWNERLDPSITIRKDTEKPWQVDHGSAGREESTPPVWVTSGTYYFKIENVLKNIPQSGYDLTITFTQKKE